MKVQAFDKKNDTTVITNYTKSQGSGNASKNHEKTAFSLFKNVMTSPTLPIIKMRLNLLSNEAHGG